MSRNIHLVIGGFPELAAALERCGAFEGVHRVGSTAQLRDAIQGGVFPKDKNRVVFLFADDVPQDTEQTLDYLAGRMSTTGWKVVILALTPRARDIVAAHPSTGLLEGPFSVNQVIAAVLGLGVGPLEPVPNGFDAVYPNAVVSESANWNPAPKPAPVVNRGAWTRAADAPVEPVATPQARPESSPAVPSPFQSQTPAPHQPAPRPDPSPLQRPAAPPPRQPAPFQRPVAPAPVTAPATTPAPFQRPAAPAPMHVPEQDRAGQGFARPASPGPIGRRIGAYQDFAPTGAAKRRGYVITVASPKGGTGKSSLSVNLAVFLGLSLRGTNKRVCLIDANFQQADTGKMLNEYSPNITNIVKDEGSMTPERIEQYLVHRRDLNTSFLLGPPTPRDASPVFFNARLYTQIIEVLRQNFDYILIDTPVAELYHDILRGFALPQADYIVVPITPALHTLMNADGWLRTITQSRHQGGDDIDQERVGIVLNQAQDGVDCDEDQVKRELFAWRFVGSVPLTKEWVRCNNNNEFVATKNFPDINDALANILYNATGEQILLDGMQPGAGDDRPRGIRGLLRRRK